MLYYTILGLVETISYTGTVLHHMLKEETMRAALESRMYRCLCICVLLLSFATGLAYAQADSMAATQNSWYVTGLFRLHYRLPIDEGEYVEEGTLSLDVNPRVLWFPADGFGVGVDADFYYFGSHFTDLNLGIGPRMAFFLDYPAQKDQLMPHIGGSFQYVMNDVNPGAITEAGWRLRLELGISPVIGGYMAVPVELGFMAERLTSDYNLEPGRNYTLTSFRIYLETGIGAFLWKSEAAEAGRDGGG